MKNKTIKQDDYIEFFEYYVSIIDEMDDEFGAWMNAPWITPEFIHKNWEEIQSRMMMAMHHSIRELGERMEKKDEVL